MDEDHGREQYFFDAQTVNRLADLLSNFRNPCCLCAPMVGREATRRGQSVRVLDLDERFADLRGFLKWDINRPQYLNERFDLILVDPPFFGVSLSSLFDAVRLLCHFESNRRLMVSYPTRREGALIRAFAPFHLAPTGWRPGYNTVENAGKNGIDFYANWNLG